MESATADHTADTAAKKVTLVSSDGDPFEVDEEVAMRSVAIKNMIEDGCADSPIPVPNVTTKCLRRVLKYLNKHAEFDKHIDMPERKIKAWDARFVKIDKVFLFEVIRAANYLNITDLLHVTCRAVADMIRGKSPEEVRRMFNIENDLTPDEVKEIREQNKWFYE